MSVITNILIVFHVLVSLLMIGIVLMQRPKSEGLGTAFGGGMTENIFGAQTTDILKKFTVWLGIVFFSITLLLAVIYAKRGTGETAVQRELMAQPIPTVPANTAAPTTDSKPADAAATAAPVVSETINVTETSTPAVQVESVEVVEDAAAPEAAATTPQSNADQNPEPEPAAPAPAN